MQQNNLISFLRQHAGKFVVVAWLLVLLTVAAALTIGVVAVVNNFYHPLHQSAAYDKATIQILWASLFAGVAAGLLSSIALALGWRIAAAGSVIAIWAAVTMGSTFIFASTQPGPQFFERYVGGQRYHVPWQFEPIGLAASNDHGFSVHLCIDSLRGNYERACRATARVTVRRRGGELREGFDERYWRKHREEMQRLEEQHGHESYLLKETATNGSVRTTTYHPRYDADGRLMRFVRCYRSNFCRHHTLIEDYELSYDEAMSPEWKIKDAQLAKLIASWRAPGS